MKNDKFPVTPCHIKELNISCFGCCGNSFTSRKEVLEDIKLNTEELVLFGNVIDREGLINFRDRFDGDNALSLNGLCYNVVDLGSSFGCFGCPLHDKVKEIMPKDSKFKIVNDEDLRVGHCNVNEECGVFVAWKSMSDIEKMDFIEFVRLFKFDSYSYSLENGEERLLSLYEKYKDSLV